jgi:hypothetical protein
MYLSRLLRGLMREIKLLARGATDEHWRLRNRLAVTFLATLVVDAIGTTLMYTLEHGKNGSAIHSVFQGFFWVTTQLLTVSSQMPNPVTTGGRIVDIFLELWAITVVATAAGSIAAFFQEKSPTVPSASPQLEPRP